LYCTGHVKMRCSSIGPPPAKMILSNVEIHRALDEGRLVLYPEPEPRKPGDDGAEVTGYSVFYGQYRLK
jgi:hypothetical protein